MSSYASLLKGDCSYYVHGGVPFVSPRVPEARVAACKEYPNIRDDDVIIWTYPKCGTHWASAIAMAVLSSESNASSFHALELVRARVPEDIVPGTPWQDIFQQLEEAPSPRVIFTHLPPHLLPDKIMAPGSKVKIISVVRNPKDTCVSYCHFENKVGFFKEAPSSADYCRWFLNGEVMFGSYTTFMKHWHDHKDDENMLTLTFENMKKDLNSSVAAIAEFLGKSLTGEEIEKIAKSCTFSEMQSTHPSFLMRKGESGDWKNHLTVNQSEAIDDWIESELGGYNVPLTYE